MSETKFTEGPWCIKEIEDDKEYIRVRGTRLGRKFKIANVIDLKNHHDESKWCKEDRAESLANAHLIAAAPEMYQLLERFLPYSTFDCDGNEILHGGDFNWNEDDDPMIDELKTLLAKARGEK